MQISGQSSPIMYFLGELVQTLEVLKPGKPTLIVSSGFSFQKSKSSLHKWIRTSSAGVVG